MESNQPNYTFTCSMLKGFTSLIFSSLMTGVNNVGTDR